MDWNFITPLPGTNLLPLDIASNGNATLLTLRLRAERNADDETPSPAPAGTETPEQEFRRLLAERLKHSAPIETWRERRREMIAAKKRWSYFGSQKVDPLLAERRRIVGEAKKGWAGKAAEIDAQLGPLRHELSRLAREIEIVEKEERAAEQAVDSELLVASDQTVREVCERRKDAFDAILSATACKIGPDVDSLLHARNGLILARALFDRKHTTLDELAEDVLAER